MQSRTLCVKCPTDGELPSERKEPFLAVQSSHPAATGESPFVAHYGTEGGFFMENETKNPDSLSRETRSRRIKIITLAGVFIAVEIVTEYYLSFTLGNQYRISLTSLIRAIAGFSLGWVGGIVSVLTDLIGGFIRYGASMIPTLTAVRGLQGLTHGLLLHKRLNTAKIVCAAVISTFFLNALGLVARYTYTGTPLSWAIATPSLIVYAVTTVVEILVVSAFRATIVPRISGMMYSSGVWTEKDNKPVTEEKSVDD